jgi:hypothetical protein
MIFIRVELFFIYLIMINFIFTDIQDIRGGLHKI